MFTAPDKQRVCAQASCSFISRCEGLLHTGCVERMRASRCVVDVSHMYCVTSDCCGRRCVATASRVASPNAWCDRVDMTPIDLHASCMGATCDVSSVKRLHHVQICPRIHPFKHKHTKQWWKTCEVVNAEHCEPSSTSSGR